MMQPINLYTMQQIQQVYQSQIMTSSVHGENRMKETAREVPRFGEQLARAAEPVTRKVTQQVESAIDERSAMPAMLYRAMDGEVSRAMGGSGYVHWSAGGEQRMGGKQSISGQPRRRMAHGSYTAAMEMAGSPADYVDHQRGTNYDIIF